MSSIVTIGTRICFDGGPWEVGEMTAAGVVLGDTLGQPAAGQPYPSRLAARH